KILAGIVHPDSGEIRIDGELRDLGTPARSLAAGIAVVQQELSLVPPLSAAENVFLGGGRFRGPWTRARPVREARPFLGQAGLAERDPGALVETLSVAERQLVEIARLIARDARILILDEPTAALSDVEIARVKEVVRSLAGGRRAVIYVTHRLAEVFEIADRVTVLRNGAGPPPARVSRPGMESPTGRIPGPPPAPTSPPRAR